MDNTDKFVLDGNVKSVYELNQQIKKLTWHRDVILKESYKKFGRNEFDLTYAEYEIKRFNALMESENINYKI